MYEDLKSGFPESVQFIYFDVTKEELSTIEIEYFKGQTRGIIYIGSDTELVQFKDKELIKPVE